MFARWRNLAAVAGAIWFPIASAQGTPDRSELRYETPCTRPTARAEYHDRSPTNCWQSVDREAWYQQYYGNSLSDLNPGRSEPEQSPSPASSTGGIDDSQSTQAAPNHNDSEPSNTNDPVILEPRIEVMKPVADGDDRCEDPSGPCHDINALDSEDQTSPANSLPCICPANDPTPPCGDANDADAFEAEPSGEPLVELGSALRLSGTIEPIIESETEAVDGSVVSVPEITIGSAISSDDDSTPTDGIGTDTIEHPANATEDLDNNSAGQSSRYHMFYPGCDWSPYDPLQYGRGGDAADATDHFLPIPNTDDLQELTSEAD